MAFAAGDRNPGHDCTYPAKCLIQNGGRIYNVKFPPDGRPAAVGNGMADDTEAIRSAYEYLAQKVIDTFNDGKEDYPGGYDDDASLLIYLPDGTYLVSDTLAYRQESPIIHKQKTMVYVRFWGQSKERTVIRLKDATFTDPENPQVVLPFHKDGGSSAESVNSMANLTVNVGRRNPGAIGVLYQVPNSGHVHNVRIISEDGLGKVGLYFPVWSVQTSFRDITIEGFEVGIQAVWIGEVNPVFSHLTLRNQTRAGIENVNGGVFVRELDSTNSVPAVIASGDSGHTVIIDSQLRGGAPENPALRIASNGVLFARNLSTEGYGCAIEKLDSVAEPGPRVEEWVSHPVTSLFPERSGPTLGLEIKDPPEVPWFDPRTEWTCPDEFGGVGDGVSDDTAAIQAALDSGKPVIYFPRKRYRATAPLSLPATVRRIDFLFGFPGSHVYKIREASDQPILFTNGGNLAGKDGALKVRSFASRTVSVRGGLVEYTNLIEAPQEQQVFFDGCVIVGGESENWCKAGQKTWGHGINSEENGIQFRVKGGTLWAAGYKCERRGVNFRVEDGGRAEIMSGYANTFNQDGKFLIENEDSEISFMGFTRHGSDWKNIVWEKQQHRTRSLKSEAFPSRPGDGRNCVFVPLYTSRGGTTITE